MKWVIKFSVKLMENAKEWLCIFIYEYTKNHKVQSSDLLELREIESDLKWFAVKNPNWFS